LRAIFAKAQMQGNARIAQGVRKDIREFTGVDPQRKPMTRRAKAYRAHLEAQAKKLADKEKAEEAIKAKKEKEIKMQAKEELKQSRAEGTDISQYPKSIREAAKRMQDAIDMAQAPPEWMRDIFKGNVDAFKKGDVRRKLAFKMRKTLEIIHKQQESEALRSKKTKPKFNVEPGDLALQIISEYHADYPKPKTDQWWRDRKQIRWDETFIGERVYTIPYDVDPNKTTLKKLKHEQLAEGIIVSRPVDFFDTRGGPAQDPKRDLEVWWKDTPHLEKYKDVGEFSDPLAGVNIYTTHTHYAEASTNQAKMKADQEAQQLTGPEHIIQMKAEWHQKRELLKEISAERKAHAASNVVDLKKEQEQMKKKNAEDMAKLVASARVNASQRKRIADMYKKGYFYNSKTKKFVKK
jgi:hypothetical protein